MQQAADGLGKTTSASEALQLPLVDNFEVDIRLQDVWLNHTLFHEKALFTVLHYTIDTTRPKARQLSHPSIAFRHCKSLHLHATCDVFLCLPCSDRAEQLKLALRCLGSGLRRPLEPPGGVATWWEKQSEPGGMSATILYYTILYYTILYYTILYYTILYYTILYYTIVTPVPPGKEMPAVSCTVAEVGVLVQCAQASVKAFHATLSRVGLQNMWQIR